MNLHRTILSCLLLLFSNSFLFADWDELLKNYAKTYSTPYHDGFLSSMAATCHLRKIPYDEMKVKIETWNVFASDLESGRLKGSGWSSKRFQE
ncbi:hypothetical protein HOF92_13410 [bacterium]|jgi:hypothetical protein|nr:hypothetical protein [bacterium]